MDVHAAGLDAASDPVDLRRLGRAVDRRRRGGGGEARDPLRRAGRDGGGGGRAETRDAALVVIGMMVARILLGRHPAMVFTAATAVALAVAAAASLSPADPGLAPYAIAALVAAGTAFLPAASPRAA